LESNHTFSFNRYYDPKWSGFRHLRVINEDYVAPGQGFGTHSHRDMEILSYVVAGQLAHQDSTGGRSVIRPGEMQRMTAGTGVSHSEFNPSGTEPTHFLQIWIIPEREGLTPGYEQREFPFSEQTGKLHLVASPDGNNGSLTIHQQVKLYLGLLGPDQEISYELPAGRHAWTQVVRGELALNGASLQAGDGAAISDERQIRMQASVGAGVLLFDLA
jgi:redox-sensitive bicupin YhaK (pirin superfamily)